MNSQRLVHSCYEYVFHFTKTGRVPLDRLAIGVAYQDKSNVTRWAGAAGQDRRCRGNVWVIPYRTIRDRASQRPHPATFPVRLPEWCLALHGVSTIRGVLDPFVGSGTTAIAAQRLNVPCIGFDIDEDYIRQAGGRLRDGEGQQRDLGFNHPDASPGSEAASGRDDGA